MTMFDYEVPHRCQYVIAVPSPADTCNKPAAYYVWWRDGPENNAVWLCQEHFDKVCKDEEA